MKSYNTILDYENPPEDFESVELLIKRGYRTFWLVCFIVLVATFTFEGPSILYGIVFIFLFISAGTYREVNRGVNVFAGLRECAIKETVATWKSILPSVARYFKAERRMEKSDVFSNTDNYVLVLFLLVFIYLPFVVLPAFIFGVLNAIIMSYLLLVNLLALHGTYLLFFGREVRKELAILQVVWYSVLFSGVLFLTIKGLGVVSGQSIPIFDH